MDIALKPNKEKTERRKSLPIKAKLLCYFLVFAAVLLSILWIFQGFLFDDVYRFIKSRQLESDAKSIAEKIDSEDIKSYVLEVQNENAVSVGVYRIGSQVIYELYSSRDKNNYTSAFVYHEVYGFYSLAKESGGRVTCSNLDLEDRLLADSFQSGGRSQGRKAESLVCAQVVENSGVDYMVLVKARFAPVESTVETLRIMLLFITALFVVFALIMAFYCASKLSKPIRRINKSAKELAKQNYRAAFDGKGSRETEELSDTLNFAAGELSKVDGLRRELIANISHDLRTPLTMIGGYAEVMRDIPGENTPENLQIIVDETERLSALVTDLLSLSRLEAGSSELEKSEFSLTESVRSIFKRYSKLVQDKELSLSFECDCDVWVFADEIKLSQVIYNLINNAINYSESPKEVRVRQSVHEDKVLLEIIDKGKGIPQEELSFIWDRYYRAKEEHKIATVGTGLGLSIVKKILLLHNARFGVKSQEGVGSNFWFEIDRLPERQELPENEEKQEQK